VRKRKKVEEEERRNHRGKIECPHLLCRAAIISVVHLITSIVLILIGKPYRVPEISAINCSTIL